MDLEAARQGLAAQPFSRLVGATLPAFGQDGVTLEIPIRPELMQQNGFLHGGVLAFAADNALTFAAGAVLGPSLLTAGFTIDYLKPALGRLLRAHATVVKASRAGATTRCDLYTVDDAGVQSLCAAAQGRVAISTR